MYIYVYTYIYIYIINIHTYCHKHIMLSSAARLSPSGAAESLCRHPSDGELGIR